MSPTNIPDRSLTKNELSQWIQIRIKPLLIGIKDIEDESAVPGGAPLVIFYYSSQKVLLDHKKDPKFDLKKQLAIIESHLEEIAAPFVGLLRFASIDLDYNIYIKKKLVLPKPNAHEGILIWSPGSLMRHHPVDTPATFFLENPDEQKLDSTLVKESVLDLIRDFKHHRTSPVIYSMKDNQISIFADQPNSNAVVHTTASQWQSRVIDTPSFVVMFVFLPGCPYCHEFAPEFRKVAAFWAEGKFTPQISFVEFNYQDNDFPLFADNPSFVVEEFPTLLLFPPLNWVKNGVTYNRTHPYRIEADLTGYDLVVDLRLILEIDKPLDLDAEIHAAEFGTA